MFNYPFLFIFIFFCQVGNAQFQKSSLLTSRGATHINNNGDLIHGGQTIDKDNIITKFNLAGDIAWSKKLLPFDDAGEKVLLDFRLTSQLLENSNFIFSDVLETLDSKVLFSKLNSLGDIDFAKLIEFTLGLTPLYNKSKQYVPHSISFDSNEFLLMSYLSKSKEEQFYYSFIKFNVQGDLLWHKEFKDNLPGNPIRFINKIGTKNFALIRNGFFHPNEKEVKGNLIQILDENFQTIKTLQFNGNIQKIIFKKGHYYILAKNDNPETFHSPHPNSIYCLDSDFEIQWAKEYVLETERIVFTFSETSFGFILSEYIDRRKNVNLIAVDLEGELIFNRVIAANSPRSRAPSVSNTHILLETRFKNELGSQLQLTCMSNTLDDLKCYASNNCVSVFDFEANIDIANDFFLEPVSLNITIKDALVETEDYTPDYLNYCNQDFSDFPIPIFDIPDTVCVNEEITIFNLQNQEANAINWIVPNSTIGSSTSATPLSFSYPEAGTYTITQQTTVEGCTNEYSQDIVVKEPIEFSFETDISLCDRNPYTIDASSDLAINYLWQNGTTNSELLTETEGTFNLALSDKFCTQSIDFNLVYFDYDSIDPQFSTDTTICIQEPLLLGTALDPAVQIKWSDESISYPRLVSKSGTYTLTSSLEGCEDSYSITIQAEDCSTKVFVPSVFSPNKDGINDNIYPLGNNFEVLNFSIFDQWGTLVHNNLSPWNGIFRNEEANMGVYIYTLNLRNLRLDTIEKYSGNLTLIR